MRNKPSTTPKPKGRLQLKKAFFVIAGAAVLSGILWKVFIGTAATVGSTGDVFGMFTPATGPQISNYNWQGFIHIDHSKVEDTVDLVDFPFLFSTTDAELKSITHGGNVASEFGYDILFCGENDAQLDHQIESYDPTTGEVVAWVRLPILYHDVDTELKITCGNSNITTDQSTQSVWSMDYEAVWHMNDNPSSSNLKDAAGTYDAQPFGMNSSDLVSGKVGDAIDFDGNDYFAIQGKHYNSSNHITQMTVSSWVKTSFSHNSWTQNWSILDFDRSEYFNFFVHGCGKISFCNRATNGGIQDFHAGQYGQVNDGNWHHVTAVFDGSSKSLYIDGVLVSSVSTYYSSMGSNATRYGFIGDGSEASTFNGPRNNKGYTGKIDELRLLTQARSAGWIATEFNNQSSPETFFSINDTQANLPIELGAFDAYLDGDEVIVEWATVSERDNDYFTIERSLDGTNFEGVGTVDGAGNSTEYLEYDFIDDNPEPGLSYYRLRQTDFDGKTEAFSPVAIEYIVEIDNITIDKTYPNPFTNNFKAEFTASASTEVEFVLINSNGLQVQGDVQYVYSGKNTYEFHSTEQIPSGLYFFNILQNGEKKASVKLIKQ